MKSIIILLVGLLGNSIFAQELKLQTHYIEFSSQSTDPGNGNLLGVESFSTFGKTYFRGTLQNSELKQNWYGEVNTLTITGVFGYQLPVSTYVSFNFGVGIFYTDSDLFDDGQAGYLGELGLRFQQGETGFFGDVFYNNGDFIDAEYYEVNGLLRFKFGYNFSNRLGLFAIYQNSSEVDSVGGGLRIAW